MAGNANEIIERLLVENSSNWLAIEGVEAVGQGRFDGQDCIKFYVSHEGVVGLPQVIEGIPIDVCVSGVIETQE